MERPIATSALPCVSGFWRTVAKPLSAFITLAAPATALSFPVIQFDLPRGFAAMPAAAVAVAATARSAGAAVGDAVFVFRSEPQSDAHSSGASVTRGSENDWEAIESWTWGDLREQISGSSLTARETFSFNTRSLRAPELHYGAKTHADYGGISHPAVALMMEYSDIFAATLAVASSSAGFHTPAPLTITLGSALENGAQMLAQVCLATRSAGADGCKYASGTTNVPTPPLLPLMGIGLLGIGLARRRA